MAFSRFLHAGQRSLGEILRSPQLQPCDKYTGQACRVLEIWVCTGDVLGNFARISEFVVNPSDLYFSAHSFVTNSPCARPRKWRQSRCTRFEGLHRIAMGNGGCEEEVFREAYLTLETSLSTMDELEELERVYHR